MKAADFARRGITLSLVEGGLRFHCDRGITSAEKQLVADHKAELLAELQGPKPTMATLVRAAEARNWEIEFISTKDEVPPPLPKEIVAELLGRGFLRRVIDSMSQSEAADWLFRDGGPRWEMNAYRAKLL